MQAEAAALRARIGRPTAAGLGSQGLTATDLERTAMDIRRLQDECGATPGMHLTRASPCTFKPLSVVYLLRALPQTGRCRVRHAQGQGCQPVHGTGAARLPQAGSEQLGGDH